MGARSMIPSSQSFETLDVQVKGLERDVGELKDGIAGLDAKIDKSIASLAHEVRAAVSSLTSQFTERQRTPWPVLIGALGLTVTMLGFVGNQALSPVLADIKHLKENLFPREEAVFRYSINDRRLTTIEAGVIAREQRRYEELLRQIDRLEADKRELQRTRPSP